ncbi:Dihydroflavonol 4-reductase [Lachnellula occidentalis]|uniref:Dihydroflavonol 4-reductase n=1 Tax=Lachnellula occidentalis TaxID=215460 RepID=A0A8H8UCY3_9HELO|nr:Dihydroflavonol 4-reductase [Lachnellula occidentalis]
MFPNPHIKDLLFPTTGTLLITGATGNVASNIIIEALSLGLSVIGTVRKTSSIPILASLFNNPAYSSVVIADISSPGVFDDVVKGVDAILLTATPTYGPVDPEDLVPQSVAYVTGVARSALAAKRVKRIVYTGTIPVVFSPGKAYKQDRTTWGKAGEL